MTDTRDLRDPQKLGEALLESHRTLMPLQRKLSVSYDRQDWSRIEPYSSNPTTLEKYGRPQDLPTTPF